MKKHLIYVPNNEYNGIPELLNKVPEFLTKVASEYDLQPFHPDGDPLQINFYRKEEGIEIEVNYFVFNQL
jgi:hypothetical protein